jgi:hypothetical protein
MNHLNKTDQCLLKTLSRVKFATLSQLAFFCNVHLSTILRRLRVLKDAGIVASDENREPIIWTIKNLGARIAGTSLPCGGRHAGWPVKSHACHRNEVEIMLHAAKDSMGFRFIDRTTLFKRGLHPGKGEHGGIDDAKHAYLILLDDYMMKPERISHTWERPHQPPRKFYSGHRNVTWNKVVNYFIVATTDEFRAEQHATWIEKHAIPAKVITIKPLWR